MQKNVKLTISGMHCGNCSGKIKKALENKNITVWEISYEKGTLSCFAEDAEDIISIIEKMGYKAKEPQEEDNHKKFYTKITIGIIVFLGVFLIIRSTINLNYGSALQESVSYPLLFVLGLVTSLHCLSMCGGIVLSQSVAFEHPVRSSVLYNIGRVTSYTVLGGLIGGLGSIVSFSPLAKNMIMVFAGAFMILLGLSMLETFSFLRRFVKLPKIFHCKGFKQNRNAPLLIGLGTGFMPCGPLQTVQLYALGTGSVFAGALSMFVFSIGTVPLMMGLGTLSAFINKALNRRLLKLSGVLVIFLGLVMVSQGISLQIGERTVAMDRSNEERELPILGNIVNGSHFVTTVVEADAYLQNRFILEADRPVKWMVNVEEISDCNREILSDFGVEQSLVKGHNLIEFTPMEEGVLSFNCEKGVLQGEFIIVESLGNIPEDLEYRLEESLDCCTD